MRIKTIRIQNFRSFKDLSVALESFTSLVGQTERESQRSSVL